MVGCIVIKRAGNGRTVDIVELKTKTMHFRVKLYLAILIVKQHAILIHIASKLWA